MGLHLLQEPETFNDSTIEVDQFCFE